jgi:hypothetical protein
MDFDVSMLPGEFRQPDIIWASPPCTKFSVMTIYRNWKKEGNLYIPKNAESIKACEIVKKTLKIIEDLKPRFWIIENPMGMLRKQEFIKDIHKDTVTYCQYGMPYQKKTDLWNNLNHKFKPACSPKSPCHQRSPRGSKIGIQGTFGYRENRNQKHPIDISRTKWDDRVLRAVVPKELCLEIIEACEKRTI